MEPPTMFYFSLADICVRKKNWFDWNVHNFRAFSWKPPRHLCDFKISLEKRFYIRNWKSFECEWTGELDQYIQCAFNGFARTKHYSFSITLWKLTVYVYIGASSTCEKEWIENVYDLNSNTKKGNAEKAGWLKNVHAYFHYFDGIHLLHSFYPVLGRKKQRNVDLYELFVLY